MPSQRLLILTRATGRHEVDSAPFLIRRATSEDGRAHGADIGAYRPETFRRRLTGLNRCYLAIEHGRILHSSWCATGPTWTEELGTFLAPPPGDAYVYESFTRPDARGRGIYPLVLRAISGDLHEQGHPRMWIGVEATNEASIRAIRKAGFEDVFTFVYSGPGRDVAVEPDGRIDPTTSLHIVTPLPPDGPEGG